ncbi:hypothetical protein L873DRAFT_1822252 [Choiromyces venosus 120613-1]|uniref:Uncharacterized protein n=1 Tax=Choiromyces venosus 120613-1 TaxID=1336337 RepID=A0A3N4J7B9_9PEZI|nr:hypothetical protein L873DRAFT_1822252 [Choiromyces venosus 120613-1]
MSVTVAEVPDAAAPSDITSSQIPYRLPHCVKSEVSITLAIIPPSRPLTPQQEDEQPASPHFPSQTLSPTSPTTRTRSGSIASSLDIASDDGACVNSAATSVTDISLASNISDIISPDTAIYHIYRNGRGDNLSIHTAKDSSIKETLQEPGDPPIIVDKGDPIANRISKYKNRKSKLPAKKVKVEDPEMDPRKATYYMHSPMIYWHCPAQTLRFGHSKMSPVVCLVKGGWFWRTWRMDFVVPEKELKKSGKKNRVDSGFADGEDKGKSAKEWKSLNEPGVIDPRGVLACKYPLRPSGHKKGESGKKYLTECAQRQKMTNAASDPQLKRTKSFSDTARRIFHLNNASPTSRSKEEAKATTESKTEGTAEPTTEPTREEEIESMLPAGPTEDLPDHLKPETLEEGSLLMKWSGWLTREYDFKWRGIEFVWKGTGTVRDEKKYWGPLSRFNHLKLVAKIPEEPEEVEEEESPTSETKDDKKGPQTSTRRQSSFSSFVSTITRRNSNASQLSVRGKPRGHREVVIAKYTCLLATRKCGRLIVYEKALRETACLNLEGNNPDVARERLRHVVVATGLCMLQGEKQKRDTLREIAGAALGEAGSCAG